MKSKLVAALIICGVALTAFAEEIKTDLYTVVDGVNVDKNTMEGFRTWLFVPGVHWHVIDATGPTRKAWSGHRCSRA
jgi:hypothetical protein